MSCASVWGSNFRSLDLESDALPIEPVLTKLHCMVWVYFSYLPHSCCWSLHCIRFPHRQKENQWISLIFNSHEKNVRVCSGDFWAVCPAKRLTGRHCPNHNVKIFFLHYNVINVKLHNTNTVIVLLLVLRPFVPLSMTLIAFQGHSSMKQLTALQSFERNWIRNYR